MAEHTDLARELRDEYPAVDVTAVVFSRDFAGIACCVIPQDRVLAVISALEGAAAWQRARLEQDDAVRSKHDALVKALEECRRRLEMDLDEIQHLRGWLSDSELAERADQDELADQMDKLAIFAADEALATARTSAEQGVM